MSNLVQLYLMLKMINKIGTHKIIGQYIQNCSQSGILEMNRRSKIVTFSSAIILSVLWLLSARTSNFILLM
jgi:hypothetical protein